MMDHDEEGAVEGPSSAAPSALRRAPEPPRTARNVAVVVMACCAALSLFLMWSLRHELTFAFRANTPVELGAFDGAPLAGKAGQYVRVKVDRIRQLASYHRIGEADAHVLGAVGQASSGRWIEFRVPQTQSGPRFIAPSLVAGRLVPVSELGLRHQGVSGVLPSGAGPGWLLIDGESPASLGWVPALALLLAAFAVWNTTCLVRILRRPKA